MKLRTRGRRAASISLPATHVSPTREIISRATGEFVRNERALTLAYDLHLQTSVRPFVMKEAITFKLRSCNRA